MLTPRRIQPKVQSKIVDDQLWRWNHDTSPPLRILLMGGNNSGIKTYMVNVEFSIPNTATGMNQNVIGGGALFDVFSAIGTVERTVSEKRRNDLSSPPEESTSQTMNWMEPQKLMRNDVVRYMIQAICYFITWERKFWKRSYECTHQKSASVELHYVFDGSEEELELNIVQSLKDHKLTPLLVDILKTISTVDQHKLQKFHQFLNGSNHRIIENCRHFFSPKTVERLLKDNFKYQAQDILGSYHQDLEFKLHTICCGGFEYIDISGQMNERRKWIHMFSGNIDHIMFFIPISDYNLKDPQSQQNRLVESIQLLKEVAKSELFCKADITMMFTKLDILQNKLQTHPFKDYFPEYNNPNNTLKEVSTWIKDYVMEQLRSEGEETISPRQVYYHFINLTDTYSFNIVQSAFLTTMKLGSLYSMFAKQRQ